ncbi:hypothetical protein BCT27_15200 [Enterovibrio norvegicus]|nr:hypothetical protein BCT27_15200 [Enterovibrio norvegicus]
MLASLKLLLVSFSILFFLSGCKLIPEPDPSVEIKSQGVLVASFNSPLSLGIEIERDDGKSYFLITGHDVRKSRNTWRWVEPGNYRITALLVQTVITLDRVELRKDTFLPFEVKLGGITDLNTLVPLSLGGGTYSLLSLPREKDFTPNVVLDNLDLFKNAPEVSWTSSNKPVVVGKIEYGSTGQGLIADLIVDHEKESQQTRATGVFREGKGHYDTLKKYQHYLPVTGAIASGEDGKDYIGTYFGKIKVWGDRKSNPLIIDTGSIHAVVALDVSDNNHIYAALDSGAIIVSYDEGNSWNELFRLSSDEIIFYIKEINSKMYIGAWKPAAGEAFDKYRANASVKPNVSLFEYDNQKINTLVSVDANATYAASFNPTIINNNNEIYIAFPDDNFVKVDINSGVSTQSKLLDDLHGMALHKDGSMTMWLRAGIFSDSYKSTDLGTTWQEVDIPPNPLYLGYNAYGDLILWNQRDYQKINLNKFFNGEWQLVSQSPQGCVRLLMNDDGLRAYCTTANGLVREFYKGGWGRAF